MSARGTRARADAGAGAEPGSAGALEGALRRALRGAPGAQLGARFLRAWPRTLRLLRPLGVVSHATRVQVLVDGDAAFEALWQALDGAVDSVVLTTYIFEPDRVGDATLAALLRAARRGCRVLLVVDAFGSHRLDDERLAPLRAAGGRVVRFNPIVRARGPLSRLVRNHRKIVALDGRVAFVGGMNVAEEYAGLRYGNGYFRDTQLALEGPCAAVLAQLVEELAGAPGGLPPAPLPPPPPGARLVTVHDSQGRRGRRHIQRALRTLLARAQEHAYLTSPYFVPPARLVRALLQARRRGVDVCILTAGRSDVPLVRLAGQHLYGRLLRRGVRIWELENRTLHAKAVTVDGMHATVGSFNLDHWSDRRNLEVTVGILDGEATAELERQFAHDLTGAREVTLASWSRRGWIERLLGWVAYLLLRV